MGLEFEELSDFSRPTGRGGEGGGGGEGELRSRQALRKPAGQRPTAGGGTRSKRGSSGTRSRRRRRGWVWSLTCQCPRRCWTSEMKVILCRFCWLCRFYGNLCYLCQIHAVYMRNMQNICKKCQNRDPVDCMH